MTATLHAAAGDPQQTIAELQRQLEPVSRQMFADILSLIARLRAPPAPA